MLDVEEHKTSTSITVCHSHVHVYVAIYMCMYVCLPTCACMCACPLVHVCVPAYKCVYFRPHVCACVPTNVYVCVSVHPQFCVCVPDHVTNFVAGKHRKASGPISLGKRLQDQGDSQCVHVCIGHVIEQCHNNTVQWLRKSLEHLDRWERSARERKSFSRKQ